jgi:hypothetical protein
MMNMNTLTNMRLIIQIPNDLNLMHLALCCFAYEQRHRRNYYKDDGKLKIPGLQIVQTTSLDAMASAHM